MSAGTYACIPEKFHYNGSNLARFHQNRGLIVAVSRYHQGCLSQMKLKETHPKDALENGSEQQTYSQ